MRHIFSPPHPLYSSQKASLESYQLEQKERIAQIRLSRTYGIGPINFSQLMAQYGSAIRVLDALPDRAARLGRAAPLSPTITEIEDEIAELNKDNIYHLLRSDPDYPLLLSHIHDAPPLLYVKGDINKLSLPSIGIVGARNASIAGQKIAENLSTELAHENIIVISGLARGIDTAAHRGAVGQGMTVAALAGSIDHPYPAENAALQDKIAESGCLITEAPPRTAPQARHFPHRNRLIAGLSLGCVIIEASRQSGTLITANLAISYHRTLLAVPGSPLDPRSRGGNQLIRDGAILVETAQDILNGISATLPNRQIPPWVRPKDEDHDLFSLYQDERYQDACYQNSHPDSLKKKTSYIPIIESHEGNEHKNKKTLEKNNMNKKAPKPALKKEENPTKQQKNEKINTNNPQDNPRQYILSLLSTEPITVDAIVSHCQLSVPVIIAILGELELYGEVKTVPGRGYILFSPEKENLSAP